MTLNNPGHVGASIASDKGVVNLQTDCDFHDVAEWFEANVDNTDKVYVKINIEGAEADVIDRLATAGQIGKIDHLLIHFDVRKSPSMRDREPVLRAQLRASGVEFQAAEEIQFGGATRGTRNWLRWCDADTRTRDLRFKKLKRVEHRMRRLLYPVKVKVLARSGR